MANAYTKGMRIKDDQTYSIADMIRLHAFPWTDKMSDRKKYREYSRVIRVDLLDGNILKALPGKGRGYQVEGRNIKKFIKIYGPGLALLAKNRRTWRTKNQPQDASQA